MVGVYLCETILLPKKCKANVISYPTCKAAVGRAGGAGGWGGATHLRSTCHLTHGYQTVCVGVLGCYRGKIIHFQGKYSNISQVVVQNNSSK